MNLHIKDLLGSYEKLIMDPVHGGIPLLKHEVEIIDHPLFQRLRFICQNDILSLVFPGATHSRFLHSIGAMHVGGRMFMALIENCLKISDKRGNTKVTSDILEAISYFNRLVRCSCLLHDSGHSSFSHQFSRTPAIRELLKDPLLLDSLWKNQQVPDSIDPSSFVEHEHYSIRVAFEILQDMPTPSDAPNMFDVLSIMETCEIEASEEFRLHANSLWPLLASARGLSEQPENFVSGLKQLLSKLVSGEVDADRADYMLRDGFHSSVTIGGFNLDHLLSNLHFGVCSQTGWIGLSISQKGLGSLEDFVYSRHQMYRQVYAHKTAQGFDWLLRAAIDEVMRNKGILDEVKTCLKNISQFQNLTDSYFWEAFRQHSFKEKRSYSRCILERVKMRFLATRTNLSDEEEVTYREFLAKEHNFPVESIISSSITARFTKIGHDFEDIKILTREPGSSDETFKRVSSISQFFDKFTDDRITHFYVDPVLKASASVEISGKS